MLDCRRDFEEKFVNFSTIAIGRLWWPFLNLVNGVDQIQNIPERPIKSTEKYSFTLSWSHYLVLMRIESDEERRFYEIEAQKQNWSVRQLQRQYNSSLYERLAISKDKDSIMRLAREGQTVNKPDDIIKNPLTLDEYKAQ